jgi:soluble lytic murein transglycosylase-like protein
MVAKFTCSAAPLDEHELTAVGRFDQPPSLEIAPPSEVIEPIREEESKAFYFDVPLSNELQDYIRELCDEYEVPMELVMAMIETESSFRADVISKTDDYGLMQINAINHKNLTKKLGVTDFLDPYQNVLSGIYIISGHLDKTDGDIELALMRYNRGATGAKRLWEKGIYSIPYSKTILNRYESYKEKAAHGAGTP